MTYIQNEIVEINRNPAVDLIHSVRLASGEVIGCGQVVNASGPRAAKTAAMAGIDIPVEPRKRFLWIFLAAKPLDQELPLTINPSGSTYGRLGEVHINVVVILILILPWILMILTWTSHHGKIMSGQL